MLLDALIMSALAVVVAGGLYFFRIERKIKQERERIRATDEVENRHYAAELDDNRNVDERRRQILDEAAVARFEYLPYSDVSELIQAYRSILMELVHVRAEAALDEGEQLPLGGEIGPPVVEPDEQDTGLDQEWTGWQSAVRH